MRRGILSSLHDDDYLGLAFPGGRCGVSATICHVGSTLPIGARDGLVTGFLQAPHRQTIDPRPPRSGSAKVSRRFNTCMRSARSTRLRGLHASSFIPADRSFPLDDVRIAITDPACPSDRRGAPMNDDPLWLAQVAFAALGDIAFASTLGAVLMKDGFEGEGLRHGLARAFGWARARRIGSGGALVLAFANLVLLWLQAASMSGVPVMQAGASVWTVSRRRTPAPAGRSRSPAASCSCSPPRPVRRWAPGGSRSPHSERSSRRRARRRSDMRPMRAPFGRRGRADAAPARDGRLGRSRDRGRVAVLPALGTSLARAF